MTPAKTEGRLCGQRDRDTGAECLLSEGHYQLRGTMHRGHAYSGGRRLVYWGYGKIVMDQ